MLRKTALLIFLTSAMAIAIGVLLYPPLEKRKTSHSEIFNVEEAHKRYWEILPPEAWGVTPVKTTVRGMYEGGKIHTRRFGVIGLTEYDQLKYTKNER